jgi:hypothetical protein
MRTLRCFGTSLVIVVASIASVGCVHTDYVSPWVVVFDGESRQPIKDAYIHTPASWGASTSGGSTNAAGRAKVRMAKWVGYPWVDANGYLASIYLQPPEERQEIRVPLFRSPLPLAGLRIPKNFRGMLRVKEGAEPQPPAEISWRNGQREFYTRVVIDGVTTLQAPPKLSQNQYYFSRVFVAQFDDGSDLRFENPTEATGWSGENVYFLPDIRDRVSPRADGVALFKLGVRFNSSIPGGGAVTVYFVGTSQAAREAQEELIRRAITSPTTKARNDQDYEFKAAALSVDKLESSWQMSPRARN